jgi:hypothetical protein
MSTRDVFSEHELAGLRGFPEISQEELISHDRQRASRRSTASPWAHHCAHHFSGPPMLRAKTGAITLRDPTTPISTPPERTRRYSGNTAEGSGWPRW